MSFKLERLVTLLYTFTSDQLHFAWYTEQSTSVTPLPRLRALGNEDENKEKRNENPPCTPIRKEINKEKDSSAATPTPLETISEEFIKAETAFKVQLENDKQRLEIVAMNLKISVEETLAMLEEFNRFCLYRNKKHDNYTDYANHFMYYAPKLYTFRRGINNESFKQRKSYRNDRYAARKAAIEQRCREFVAAAEQRITTYR